MCTRLLSGSDRPATKQAARRAKLRKKWDVSTKADTGHRAKTPVGLGHFGPAEGSPRLLRKSASAARMVRSVLRGSASAKRILTAWAAWMRGLSPRDVIGQHRWLPPLPATSQVDGDQGEAKSGKIRQGNSEMLSGCRWRLWGDRFLNMEQSQLESKVKCQVCKDCRRCFSSTTPGLVPEPPLDQCSVSQFLAG